MEQKIPKELSGFFIHGHRRNISSFINDHLKTIYDRLVMTRLQYEDFKRVATQKKTAVVESLISTYSIIGRLQNNPGIKTMDDFKSFIITNRLHFFFMHYTKDTHTLVLKNLVAPETSTFNIPLFTDRKRKVLFKASVMGDIASEDFLNLINNPMTLIMDHDETAHDIVLKYFLLSEKQSPQQVYLISDSITYRSTDDNINFTLLEMVVVNEKMIGMNYIIILRGSNPQSVINFYEICYTAMTQPDKLLVALKKHHSFKSSSKKDKKSSKPVAANKETQDLIKRYALNPLLSIPDFDKILYQDDIKKKRIQIIQKSASNLLETPPRHLARLVQEKRQQNKKKFYQEYVVLGNEPPRQLHKSYKRWILDERKKMDEQRALEQYIYQKYQQDVPPQYAHLRSKIQQQRREIVKIIDDIDDDDIEHYVWLQLNLIDPATNEPITGPIRSPNNPTEIYQKGPFLTWLRSMRNPKKLDYRGQPVPPKVLDNPEKNLPIDKEVEQIIGRIRTDMDRAGFMAGGNVGLKNRLLLKLLDTYKTERLFQDKILKKPLVL